jgi:hypothetical protein
MRPAAMVGYDQRTCPERFLSMNIHSTLRLLTLTLPALLLGSCASVSVKGSLVTDVAKPNEKPEHIYVEPFRIDRTVAKEHPLRKNPGNLKTDAQTLLAKALVETLSKHIAPASLVAPGNVPRGRGWVVSGEFTRLNEGSRFLRMAFGLGMGGTKMETRVAVRNLPLRNPPFLDFETTGGSGATPGAATNPIPYSSVLTALFVSGAGVTDDARRTARMITAEIATYASRKGWIPAEAVAKVKYATQ